MKANQTLGQFEYDNLIADDKMPLQVASVTVAAGEGKLIRGTVVAKNMTTDEVVVLGTTAPEGQTLVAFGIITDEVDATTEKAIATVYVSGNFNKNALTVDDGYEIKTTEIQELREGGIYLEESM